MTMHRRTLLNALAAATIVPAATHAASGAIEARDGQRLFYVDKGAGEPVVFIHGWTLSSAIWNAQTDWLATQGLRAIAYDRRGHGQSSKPASGYDYDYETLADDLATVLDKLDLRNVVLVGHSMGAGEAGPAAVWYRAARPIVEGAPLSPLMRAAVAADFCNGTSSVLNFKEWTFINGDLTLSLAREPVGDWILLDAETWAGPDSIGIAAARLADRDGYFGRAVQSLLFEKR